MAGVNLHIMQGQSLPVPTLPPTQPQIEDPVQSQAQGCPGCGSICQNKDCSDSFCKKCCLKAAQANPQWAPCNYRAHQLSRNGYNIEQTMWDLAYMPSQTILGPGMTVAVMPGTPSDNQSSQRITTPVMPGYIQSPSISITPAPVIARTQDSTTTRPLSNILPSDWAQARTRSMQFDADTRQHAQRVVKTEV